MNFRKKFGIFLIIACLGSILSLAAERKPLLGERESDRDLQTAAAPTAGHFGQSIVVVAEPNTTYKEKTTLKFHPSGGLYILFNATDDSNNKHYVDLYKFDGIRPTVRQACVRDRPARLRVRHGHLQRRHHPHRLGRGDRPRMP